MEEKSILEKGTKYPGGFEPWPKIPRYALGGIITEKIDGTNAQVHIVNGELISGSRTRYITPEKDNYGFAMWCLANKEELLKLGEGRHYGEWWGPGIQRGYGIEQRRFSLFNTSRHKHTQPSCCHVVPVLYAGKLTDEIIDEVMYQLATKGSVAAQGFMKPEGIVIYMPQTKTMMKRTFENEKGKWYKENEAGYLRPSQEPSSQSNGEGN